jgi:DnaK suppressor protein
MLTLEQKEYIRRKISNKIEIVDQDVKYLELSTKPISPENAIGRVSRMDAINNKSVAEDSLRKAIEKQAKLKNALKNIDSKEFGVCQKCKGDINFKRIAFMPEILRCMKCAK